MLVAVIALGLFSCGGDDDNDDAESTSSSSSSGSTSASGYVDLGLSVMWATCNVGASSPEEAGSYYAWAEKSTKSSYEEDNSSSYQKYYTDISGNSSYDVAKAKLGGSYRMPTRAEAEELVDDCTWTYTSLNGTSGYNITGPSGNSIFLPITGYYDYGEISYDAYGYYWTSTPYSLDELADGYEYARILDFSSKSKSVSSLERWKGLCVRPVYGNSDSGYSLASDGTTSNHAYVDLGLSVKWATKNIGASSIEDYGNYYAWAETSTKSQYWPATSISYQVSSITQISGDSIYDAATANWGGTWRIPTKDEVEELVEECEWEWDTYGSHYGVYLTGPSGKSIFLPAAGTVTTAGSGSTNNPITTSNYTQEESGSYWTSEGDYNTTSILGSGTGEYKYSYSLFFSDKACKLTSDSRAEGLPIRPVTN